MPAENPLRVEAIFPTKGPSITVYRGQSPELIIDSFDQPDRLTQFHDTLYEAVRICPKDHLPYHQTAMQVGMAIVTERGLSIESFRQLPHVEQLQFQLDVQQRLDDMGLNDEREVLLQVDQAFPARGASMPVTIGSNPLESGQYAIHMIRSFDRPERLTIHESWHGQFRLVLKEDLEDFDRRREFSVEFFRKRGIDINDPDDRTRIDQRMLDDHARAMNRLVAQQASKY